MIEVALLVGVPALVAIVYFFHLQRLKRVQEDLTRKLRDCAAELESAHNEISRLITIDALTQVSNYSHFEDFLALEWRRACRTKTSLSLLLIDLDGFHNFNDRFGRKAGDEFLRELARLLTNEFRRPADLVARCHSDQFAVAMGQTGGQDAVTLAERVRTAIETLAPGNPDSAAHATASIGAATAVPPRNCEWGELELLRAADHALRSAKTGGGNQVCRAELRVADS